MFFFFFFQAEDGIRDLIVTGVQTCALPICLRLAVFVDLEVVLREPLDDVPFLGGRRVIKKEKGAGAEERRARLGQRRGRLLLLRLRTRRILLAGHGRQRQRSAQQQDQRGLSAHRVPETGHGTASGSPRTNVFVDTFTAARAARRGACKQPAAASADLLLLAALRQRTVVLLDELAVLLGHVVGPRQEHLVAVGVETAAQRVLEALDVVGHRLLEAGERLGVGVGTLVVELAQALDDLVELLRVDLLLAEQAAQLLRVGSALARFAAELADLLAAVAAVGTRIAERAAGRIHHRAGGVSLPVASALRRIALVAAAVA